MAHTGIFATSAECASKAGAKVSTAGWTEANINQWCYEIESFVNCLAGYNFTDNYSNLNQDVKKILTESETNYVAIQGINYDPSTFGDMEVVKLILSSLKERLDYCLNVLKSPKTLKFMEGETE